MEGTNRGRSIACVRSMRQGGPRIESVWQGDKLVTNNFGHGGAGWTMDGGSAAAVACFERAATREPSVTTGSKAVIGAGVAGLSTARALAETFPAGAVTVYAEQWHDLTSHHAGGLVAPVSMGLELPTSPWLTEVLTRAFTKWSNVAAADAGLPTERRRAAFMPQYLPVGTRAFDCYVGAGLMPPPRALSVQFGRSGPSLTMDRCATLFINVNRCMQELVADCRRAGVRFSTDRIVSYDSLDEAAVFNCAGLGARELARDKQMVGVLGHLVGLINQPRKSVPNFMTGATVNGGNSYYIPKVEGPIQGVLGGSFVVGCEDFRSNPQEFEAIWQRGRTFFYGDPVDSRLPSHSGR